jgi:hypothetical protein
MMSYWDEENGWLITCICISALGDPIFGLDCPYCEGRFYVNGPNAENPTKADWEKFWTEHPEFRPK